MNRRDRRSERRRKAFLSRQGHHHDHGPDERCVCQGGRPREYDEDNPSWNLKALDAVSSLLGYLRVVIEDLDEVVPLVEPKDDWQAPGWNFMDFDRAVCAAGVKAYVRATSPADSLPGAALTAELLLVREIAPGARSRLELEAVDLTSLN